MRFPVVAMKANSSSELFVLLIVIPETSNAALFRIHALAALAAPPGCRADKVNPVLLVLSIAISLFTAEVVIEAVSMAVSSGFPA